MRTSEKKDLSQIYPDIFVQNTLYNYLKRYTFYPCEYHIFRWDLFEQFPTTLTCPHMISLSIIHNISFKLLSPHKGIEHVTDEEHEVGYAALSCHLTSVALSMFLLVMSQII